MTGSSAAKPTLAMLILLGSMTAFGALSIDMYLPALPAISQTFGAGHGEAERTLASFLAGLAIGQLLFGPLSDRLGRKPPLIAGTLLFVVASVLCAHAYSIEAMIAVRFVQGFGGCAAMVISRAIVRDRYDTRDSARIFSILMLVFGLAPILAPLLGSYALLIGGWQTIFYLLAAFGAAIMFWVLIGLTESRGEATASTARGEHPLVTSLLLLRNRTLLAYMMAGAFNSACLFTYISASPQLMMGHYGVSPTTFSWLFGLNAVGLIAGSQVNRWLLNRHPPDRILRVASVIAACFGAAFLAIAVAGAGGIVVTMIALFCILTSFGFVFGNASALALSVDPLRAGSVSALLGASGYAVGAIAMTLGSLFADGTARPMAFVMAGSLLAAALGYRVLIKSA